MKILVAEDIQLVNDRLCTSLLDTGYFQEVLSALDGPQALRLYEQHLPDLALLDIQIPRMSGLLVAAQILKKNLRTKILMMTAFENEATICGIRNLQGICGCILKSDKNFRDLPTIICKIMQGDQYYSPYYSELLYGYLCSNLCLDKILSHAQRRLLCYVGAGYRDEQIAEALKLPFASVRNKIKVLRLKLGAQDRIDLINLAHEKGCANGSWKKLGLVGNYEIYD